VTTPPPLAGDLVEPPGTRSALLVAWGSAWLAGRANLAQAAAAVSAAEDEEQLTDDGAGVDRLLTGLRADGVCRLELTLPVPGDARGLPGPGEPFTVAALARGEGVLTHGGSRRIGLVPATTRVGPAGDQLVVTTWASYGIAGTDQPPAVPVTVAEAERDLAEALRDSTRELASLEVARWHPGLDEPLQELRRRARRGAEAASGLPPGYPPRAVALLAQADRLHGVLALACADDGGARTSAEMAARGALLRALASAVRVARLAAYNSFPAG
jgi:hypothetical protein